MPVVETDEESDKHTCDVVAEAPRAGFVVYIENADRPRGFLATLGLTPRSLNGAFLVSQLCPGTAAASPNYERLAYVYVQVVWGRRPTSGSTTARRAAAS